MPVTRTFAVPLEPGPGWGLLANSKDKVYVSPGVVAKDWEITPEAPTAPSRSSELDPGVPVNEG